MSQGNFRWQQEQIWEREKFDALIKTIVDRPKWGRDFILKMETKKGKEYAQKLRAAANKERDQGIKERKTTPSKAAQYENRSLINFEELRKSLNA